MTRTCGSRSNSSHACGNSSIIRASIALPACGRLNSNQPTMPSGPRRSTISVSYVIRSISGYVAPRLAVPRIRLAGQAEHPFREDVLVDFGGPAFDGVRPAAEHATHLVRQAFLVRAGRRPGSRRRAEQIGRHFLHPLVQRALMDFADRTFRTRSAAGFDGVPHPGVGPAADRLLGVQPHQLLAYKRIVPAARPALGTDP